MRALIATDTDTSVATPLTITSMHASIKTPPSSSPPSSSSPSPSPIPHWDGGFRCHNCAKLNTLITTLQNQLRDSEGFYHKHMKQHKASLEKKHKQQLLHYQQQQQKQHQQQKQQQQAQFQDRISKLQNEHKLHVQGAKRELSDLTEECSRLREELAQAEEDVTDSEHYTTKLERERKKKTELKQQLQNLQVKMQQTVSGLKKDFATREKEMEHELGSRLRTEISMKARKELTEEMEERMKKALTAALEKQQQHHHRLRLKEQSTARQREEKREAGKATEREKEAEKMRLEERLCSQMLQIRGLQDQLNTGIKAREKLEEDKHKAITAICDLKATIAELERKMETERRAIEKERENGSLRKESEEKERQRKKREGQEGERKQHKHQLQTDAELGALRKQYVLLKDNHFALEKENKINARLVRVWQGKATKYEAEIKRSEMKVRSVQPLKQASIHIHDFPHTYMSTDISWCANSSVSFDARASSNLNIEPHAAFLFCALAHSLLP